MTITFFHVFINTKVSKALISWKGSILGWRGKGGRGGEGGSDKFQETGGIMDCYHLSSMNQSLGENLFHIPLT